MAEEILVILGPTASGKTQLAIELAQENGAVISADSRQVYAELNIGTAKPREAWRDATHDLKTPDMVENIPHYLLNISSPTEAYTLPQWKQQADIVLEELVQAGKRPIVAGGTMLYIDSLVKNYDIPEVAPNEALREDLMARETADLYAELLQKDSPARDFIEPHHKRRIVRALEVIAATGRPFSEQRRERPTPYRFKIIGLFPRQSGGQAGWDALRENIRKRAQKMLDEGLVEETKRLADKYGADLPLLKTINYAQAPDLEKMIQANMRYARRQMNWWKRNTDIQWFENGEAAKRTLAT